MTFLAGLLATILEWAITKLVGWGIVELENVIAKIEMEAKARADAEALKKAKTDEEAKAALNRVVDDTFK